MGNTKSIGSLEWKNGKWLSGWITELTEQCDDDIFFRYQTDTMFGFMEPLIKYNSKTKRVYFLTDRCANGDISFTEYDRKGYVAKINLY